MTIRKISATTSTNSHLKGLLKSEQLPDGFVLLGEDQTAGRGQLGTSWQSQKGLSLTFSVFKRLNAFEIENQFYLSKVVSLAVYDLFKYFQIPEIKIKWPNDILSDGKKLCGILIENITQQQTIKGCIIGVGINVNEAYFPNLPNASSMKQQTGIVYNNEEVLSRFLETLNQRWQLIEEKKYSEIEKLYLEALYRLHTISVFENAQQEKFNGKITGVSREGKLLVETENDEISAFDLKEIKLLSGLQRGHI
jgi:BirA family transcriptional regulator, biotin operon repressor / biotin---[acetyl-CoA-carboxylase] ligase